MKSGERGFLLAETVRQVMDEDTAGIMITNPNTLGLFEEEIHQIAHIVHEKGGQVYCDGANMNAVMGMVDMGRSGVDVLHLNLHKTFSTPHGGGGPGSGPVCVRKHLEPFLPIPRILKEADGYRFSEDFPQSVGRLHAFYGSFAVMVRAYAYIRSMGPDGLKKASQLAVLNANYMKERLKGTFHLPYDRPCMHEFVLSDKFQKAGEGHHARHGQAAHGLRLSPAYHLFPPGRGTGALMIEPTETESMEDLDRLR